MVFVIEETFKNLDISHAKIKKKKTNDVNYESNLLLEKSQKKKTKVPNIVEINSKEYSIALNFSNQVLVSIYFKPCKT